MKNIFTEKGVTKKNLIFVFVLVCLQLWASKNIYGIPVTIICYAYTVVLLLKNQIQKAFIYHLLFTLAGTAFPIYNIGGFIADSDDGSMFNYAKCKLIGNVGVFHVITLLFLIKVFFKNQSNIKRDLPLFFTLFRILMYLSATGLVLGLIGLFFFEYHIDSFLIYSIYILTLLSYAFILLKLYSRYFQEQIYTMLKLLLIASPLASLFLFYIVKYVNYHGYSEIPIVNEISVFSPILFFLFLKWDNEKYYALIGAIASMGLASLGNTFGGKGVIFTTIIVGAFFMKLLFGNLSKGPRIKNTLFVRSMALVIFAISLTIVTSKIINNKDNTFDLFKWKASSALSLLKISSYTDLKSMPESPRTRVISIYNIIYEGIRNPVYLFFGKGYGGYFSDNLHYFESIEYDDLIRGGFPESQVESGNYSRPHDTVAGVLLTNGIIGLFLIIYISILYLRKASINYLAYATFPFLLMAFYYDVVLGLSGLLLLFASEYNPQKDEHTHTACC